MIQWASEGIILGLRPLGENKAILSAFTALHGLAKGVVRLSKTSRPILQPGSRVMVSWKGRTESQLGFFDVEPIRSVVGFLMAHPRRLMVLNCAIQLTLLAFPERHPYPSFYGAWESFLDALKHEGFLERYFHFEVCVLREMGFALKLDRCCVSGRLDELVYVSPKTGRAVSREVGDPYGEKLLALPGFLVSGDSCAQEKDLSRASALTFYFLQKHLEGFQFKGFEEARLRLDASIRRLENT